MDAEGEAKARRIDLVHTALPTAGHEAHHMQQRPEVLAVQVSQTVDGEGLRRHERALGTRGRHRASMQKATRKPLGVGVEGALRRRVDHRANVRVEPPRITHDESVHGPEQHLQERPGGFVLHEQHAQG